MSGIIVLMRHGQSEGNAHGTFTGLIDSPLTKTGEQESERAGAFLRSKGLVFDHAFTSCLQRAGRSCEIVLSSGAVGGGSIIANPALNERDYGLLAGLSKQAAIAKWGEKQVRIWRRSYDVAPPGGESIAETCIRVLPYFVDRILPRVIEGHHVLVVAHGNSLRVVWNALQKGSIEDMLSLELETGRPIICRMATRAHFVSQELMPI